MTASTTTDHPVGRGSITVDGERLATDTFEFDGDIYTIRELTGDESDDMYEASLDEKKEYNGRLNTRLTIAKALISPKVEAERVGKWGNRKLGTVLRHVNDINRIDVANPTPPAGSAEPTPPAGGEQSPAS